MAAAWVEGYHAYLKAHDTTEPTMEVDGTTYRWKMASPKEFLTPGGPMVLTRSLYQADSGGKCHVPLDAAWGMMGQFATVEVREAVLFAVAQLTPREVEAHPELPEEIRHEEECPEGTRVATERTFFENNQDRMDYRSFRRRGWPIGSGPVEAAGKTLVKVRLCRSGMRWSRPGGQYVLSLRTYLKSERWDVMWQHYKTLTQTAV